MSKEKGKVRLEKQLISKENLINWIFFAITLYFWYFTINQAYFWLYNTFHFTLLGNGVNGLLATTSSIVFGILLLQRTKDGVIHWKQSFILLGLMIISAIIFVFLFPIPIDS